MDVSIVKLSESGYANTARAESVEAVPPVTNSNNTVQPLKPQEEVNREKGRNNLTKDDLTLLNDTLNKFMQSMNADLQFEIHEKTKRMMVRLVDGKTQKVLKEFPPHELLDTLAKISDYVGSLLDKKA